MSYKQLVKEAAALLDKRVPDWADRMNLEKFDMGLRHCVLVQIFGKFDAELLLGENYSKHLCFPVFGAILREDIEGYWRQEIQDRKNQNFDTLLNLQQEIRKGVTYGKS